MNPELVRYIEGERLNGKSDVEIKSALMGGGWNGAVLEKYFLNINAISFIGLVKETVAFFSGNLVGFFVVWLIPSAVTFFLAIGMGAMVFMIFGSLVSGGSMVWTYLVVVFVLALLLLLSTFWGQAALIALSSRKLALSSMGALKKGLSMTFKNYWLAQWVGVGIIGNMMFLLIPGGIVLIWTIFASYVLVIQGLPVRHSIVYSREMVRGRFWRVTGYIVGYGLANMAISYALSKLVEIASLGLWTTVFVNVFINFVLASIGVVFLERLYEGLSDREIKLAEKLPRPIYLYTGVIGFILAFSAPLLIAIFLGV